jgi:hypothetical protein
MRVIDTNWNRRIGINADMYIQRFIMNGLQVKFCGPIGRSYETGRGRHFFLRGGRNDRFTLRRGV